MPGSRLQVLETACSTLGKNAQTLSPSGIKGCQVCEGLRAEKSSATDPGSSVRALPCWPHSPVNSTVLGVSSVQKAALGCLW